ncbi:MAG: N-acetyl-gamma-glutamyl-phosphate reductase [Dehalococcoidia bacterium]|nr:N-acetyl-gamma-glutamyl-phosphate reductase [Dehalococcoidia bacterium]
MSKTRIGIINITSYAGSELVRLLHYHPETQLVWGTGRGLAGTKLNEVFPQFTDIDIPVLPEPSGEVDIVFSALPHKASAEALLPFVGKNVAVVDISADFRLKDAGEYPRWYDFNHPAPELLGRAVYGLPELHRKQITNTRLVANPGCYPTSAILALAPAVKEGLVNGDIIIDSKSGVSGAGRALNMNAHYSEANENLSAYALSGHRHLPEITQELNLLNPSLDLSVTFLPHLVPMTRGILSSCYAGLSGKFPVNENSKKEIISIYKDFYKSEPFVKVVQTPPQTKHTMGTNLCLIHPTVDMRTGRLIVISCLDNLVKGASGQAIQNMNLMLGFPETTALEAFSIYP